MKNLLVFVLVAFAMNLFGQDSPIADIMQVEAVNLTIGEEDQEKVDEYATSLEEGKTELEENLAKLSEDYAGEIGELVKKFTDSMEKGDERMIRNEKQGVNTKANSLTFGLIKNKN